MTLKQKKETHLRTSLPTMMKSLSIQHSAFNIQHSELPIHPLIQLLRNIRGHIVGVGVGAETGIVTQLLG